MIISIIIIGSSISIISICIISIYFIRDMY